MLKITPDNYQYYKKIYSILWPFLAKKWGINPDVAHSPINVLDSWENQNLSIARKGLKEGLRDALTHLSDWPPEWTIPIDEALTKEGLQNLKQFTATIKDIPSKVLKRGRIRDLNEYYIMKELIDNLDGKFSESDISKLYRIYDEFGIKSNRNNS